MEQGHDPIRAAIAQWVFKYIRFQLKVGWTLSEIESKMNRAIHGGELDRHLVTLKLLRGEYISEQQS